MFSRILKRAPIISSVLARLDNINYKLNLLSFKICNIENTILLHDTFKDSKVDSCNLYQSIKYIRNLLKVRQIDVQEEIRIGKDYDGGYVMDDNSISKGDIAYSFGIANDVSWDWDMAKHGYNIFMYDHTIKSLPLNNPKFHFFKMGLCGNDRQPNMKTLNEFLKFNGHSDKYGIILKIDIEGWEWDCLNYTESSTLEHFSQIVFEFHHLTNLLYTQKIVSALSKLNKTHQLIHINANNYSPVIIIGDTMLPDTLEATYINKKSANFVESDRFFPTELDMPNNKEIPDIILGKWA